jgi:alpha-D-ribose 1-methylphosphonate 5-triphosphate synthase subunit PhnG
VGFGLLAPFEQVAQLNSLSYSMNSAQSKLSSKKIGIDFSRSTTGDGFYLWNRSLGLDADINLYHFMHLVLADNAIARSKTRHNTVPTLRAAFHIGSSYEFHQAEGLNPTLYNFIVGEVTVALARIIEHALPEQILVGEFHCQLAGQQGDGHATLDAIAFMQSATSSLAQLAGLELSGERIERIKCYLTGSRLENGEFTVRRITVRDKHGICRHVFNAKANIYRRHAAPILLGIEDRLLTFKEFKDEMSEHLLYAVAAPAV